MTTYVKSHVVPLLQRTLGKGVEIKISSTYVVSAHQADTVWIVMMRGGILGDTPTIGEGSSLQDALLKALSRNGQDTSIMRRCLLLFAIDKTHWN